MPESIDDREALRPGADEIVVAIHQRRVVGRDADGERARMGRNRVALAFGEHKDALQLGKRSDTRTHLPAPIVPIGGRGIWIEVSIKGPRVAIDGEAECFLPSGCLDGCRGKGYG